MSFETHKFGGTSLGDKQRIKAAADIIRNERDPSCLSLVVASAVGGATNALLKAVDEGSVLIGRRRRSLAAADSGLPTAATAACVRRCRAQR